MERALPKKYKGWGKSPVFLTLLMYKEVVNGKKNCGVKIKTKIKGKKCYGNIQKTNSGIKVNNQAMWFCNDFPCLRYTRLICQCGEGSLWKCVCRLGQC